MTQMLHEAKPLNQTWMTGWCGAAGLLGLLLLGSGFEATSGPIRLVFEVLQGPGELVLTPAMRFSLAILGAVTIGWSLTLLAVIQVTQQLGRPVRQVLWSGITFAMIAWYITDSCLSIATGFWLNTVSNTLFLAAFLVPVLRSDVLRDSR